MPGNLPRPRSVTFTASAEVHDSPPTIIRAIRAPATTRRETVDVSSRGPVLHQLAPLELEPGSEDVAELPGGKAVHRKPTAPRGAFRTKGRQDDVPAGSQSSRECSEVILFFLWLQQEVEGGAVVPERIATTGANCVTSATIQDARSASRDKRARARASASAAMSSTLTST